MRFFMCGEYGDLNRRPHFHACIFGYRFPDRKYWSKGKSGSLNYRSAQLERLWPFGQCLVGDVNYKSASYIASYIVKKVNGDMAEQHYRYVDPVTGVITQLNPEFCRMSLKPGIGAGWYEKYASQLDAFDHVVVNGRPSKPPRYYDKLRRRGLTVEKLPDDFVGPPRGWRSGVSSLHEAKAQREHKVVKSSAFKENNTPERDAVRETVTIARRSFHKVRKGEL